MKASIDIGTNTALLLVARVEANNVEAIHEEQRIPRLGTNVDGSKQLSRDAMARVVDVLNDYQDLITSCFPSVIESIKVTATSAVRDAENRDEFVSRVYSETGLHVDVLSGSEEARCTYLGALSMLSDVPKFQQVVIDIGGGSTEVAVGNDGTLQDRYSYDMGCVRFTERFLHEDPPMPSGIDNCRRAIRRSLQEYEFEMSDNAFLTGVAGTVTSLAFIDKALSSYDSNKLADHILTQDTIRHYIDKTQRWTSAELIQKYPAVMEGRADIFLAGLLILDEFMARYDFSELIVSTGGIRHGVLVGSN
jgi:exopolyphosphatase/guanosine-5'-triphosphate,3'-diphosphate pyrophosphatase